MTYNIEYLVDSFHKAGITPTGTMADQLIEYYKLLLKWNENINLTAITAFEDVVIKHFIDSVIILKHYDIPEGPRLIDIGTGAGFPGIPLKILRPDLKVLLLDSLNKRVSFLNAVIDSLCLSDIEALHGRAEELGRDTLYREKYNICVSRAVADLSVLCEYSLPFVEVGGCFIAYKSGNVKEELDSSLNALALLSGEVESIRDFVLPDSDIHRSFVIIKKIREMNSRFPRRASQIKNKPL